MVAGAIIILSTFLEKAAHSLAGSLLSRSSHLAFVAILAGVAPCPGAFLILAFSSIIGILHIGIAAVIAVSLGMAITVSVAGTVGSIMGSTLIRATKRPLWRFMGKGIRYLGGIIIAAIGALIGFG